MDSFNKAHLCSPEQVCFLIRIIGKNYDKSSLKKTKGNTRLCFHQHTSFYFCVLHLESFSSGGCSCVTHGTQTVRKRAQLLSLGTNGQSSRTVWVCRGGREGDVESTRHRLTLLTGGKREIIRQSRRRRRESWLYCHSKLVFSCNQALTFKTYQVSYNSLAVANSPVK